MKKMLHKAIIALSLIGASHAANAQSGVYFREGFNAASNMPTSLTDIVPGQFRELESGTWYFYGVYRTNGGTGACIAQTGDVYHVRFANTGTTADSAFAVTPVVNSGINTLTFHNGRAARRFSIFKTADTSALNATWTFVTLVPLTNAACDVATVTVNDATARRLKIVSRGGTDSDADSMVLTSVNPILPVKYSSFSGVETSGRVKLNWNIATEVNTSHYIIERSADATKFSEAGSLKANSSGSYNWIDNAPIAGSNFYRIKAVDKDGQLSYTSVVKISLGKKNADFVIAPNPVRGSQVNLQVSNLSKGAYAVSLFNASGQQVFAKTLTHEGGSSSYQLQLPASVKAGVYNIQLRQNETVVNKKLVVE